MCIYHMLWPLHSSIRARAPINHGLPPGPFQVLPRPRKLQTCGEPVLFFSRSIFFPPPETHLLAGECRGGGGTPATPARCAATTAAAARTVSCCPASTARRRGHSDSCCCSCRCRRRRPTLRDPSPLFVPEEDTSLMHYRLDADYGLPPPPLLDPRGKNRAKHSFTYRLLLPPIALPPEATTVGVSGCCDFHILIAPPLCTCQEEMAQWMMAQRSLGRYVVAERRCCSHSCTTWTCFRPRRILDWKV